MSPATQISKQGHSSPTHIVSSQKTMDWRDRTGRSQPPPVAIPCKFHAQRRCRNGASCPFSHAEAELKAFEPTQVLAAAAAGLSLHPVETTPQLDTRSKIPCRFSLRGICFKGGDCPFSHDIPNDGDGRTAEERTHVRNYARADGCGTPPANDPQTGRIEIRELASGTQRCFGQLRRWSCGGQSELSHRFLRSPHQSPTFRHDRDLSCRHARFTRLHRGRRLHSHSAIGR